MKLERNDTCSPGEAMPFSITLSPGLGFEDEISNPEPIDMRSKRASAMKIFVKLPLQPPLLGPSGRFLVSSRGHYINPLRPLGIVNKSQVGSRIF